MNVRIEVKREGDKAYRIYRVLVVVKDTPKMKVTYMPFGTRTGVSPQYAGFCRTTMNIGHAGIEIRQGLKSQEQLYGNWTNKKDACQYARKTMKNIKGIYKRAKDGRIFS